MAHPSPQSLLQSIAAAVAGLLILAALLIGFWPVGGSADGEDFKCGSPFLGMGRDLGYEGSEGFAACLQERSHLRWIGLGSLTLGVALGAAAGLKPSG